MTANYSYRYQIIINRQTKKALTGQDKAKCNTIIKAFKDNMNGEDIQVGLTKVCVATSVCAYFCQGFQYMCVVLCVAIYDHLAMPAVPLESGRKSAASSSLD